MNDATASHAAVLRAYPDDLLCSWVALPGSTELLSERERAHALGLLAGSGSAAAAVYVRERLTGGDLPAEARRIALEDGAIVKIDGRIHYVERRTGERTWRLRGIARGVITVDAILATVPCVDWPRGRVTAALAKADTSSWVALAESARSDKWRTVTLADLRLTVCRYAARRHRVSVLTPWVQEVTRRRVVAQRQRHGSAATPETLAIWAELELWDGTVATADALSQRADAEWSRNCAARADAAAYAAADAYAAYAAARAARAAAAAYAAARAAAAAAAATAAAAADAWDTLRDLCARLDRAEESL